MSPKRVHCCLEPDAISRSRGNVPSSQQEAPPSFHWGRRRSSKDFYRGRHDNTASTVPQTRRSRTRDTQDQQLTSRISVIRSRTPLPPGATRSESNSRATGNGIWDLFRVTSPEAVTPSHLYDEPRPSGYVLGETAVRRTVPSMWNSENAHLPSKQISFF